MKYQFRCVLRKAQIVSKMISCQIENHEFQILTEHENVIS